MRNIRISEEVWNAIARRGKFGETENDVFERVFRINPDKKSKNKPGARIATITMRARVNNGLLMVSFDGGATKEWDLPDRFDKEAIRRVRDAAVLFAKQNGATLGQENAVKKALTDAGYHLTK